MAKKPVMGRNLNALLGSGSRTRARSVEPASSPDDVALQEPPPDEPRHGAALRAVPSEASEPAAPRVITLDAEAAASLADDAVPAEERARVGDQLKLIGVERIRRGAYQPRRHFDNDLLQELADSITAQGLIQPILVRERDGGYELIAGERRWRAAQLAGLHEVPAIVRELEDRKVAAVSLIENIQRKDLNPLEEAAAFRRLCDDFGMTHQEVADSVGRSRVAVSNLMRLLDLNEDVKVMVDRGELEMGNARALLGAPLDEQPVLAERIVKQRLTTRAVEKLIRELREGKTPAPPRTVADPDIERLAERLSGVLGAPVQIRHRANGGGKLEVRYTSVEELEGILAHIR